MIGSSSWPTRPRAFEGLGLVLQGGLFRLQLGLNLSGDLLQAGLDVFADRRGRDRAFQRNHADAGKRRAMGDRRSRRSSGSSRRSRLGESRARRGSSDGGDAGRRDEGFDGHELSLEPG